MKDYIEQRAVETAQYIIEHSATVRKAAKAFNISKSTVHKDIHERLLKINPALHKEAQRVLEQNKAERHIRFKPYFYRHTFHYHKSIAPYHKIAYTSHPAVLCNIFLQILLSVD